MTATADDALRNREAWLIAFVGEVRPWFADAGHPLGQVRVSVGFPSRGALSANASKTIGQCWSGSTAADGVPQVFVSPLLGQADVGHVLVHELVHAAVGCEAGHKGAFKRAARALGLEGKLTATHASEALALRLRGVEGKLGPYPHAPLSAVDPNRKKQATRLVKLSCPCERIIRLSRTVAEQGDITCGLCRSPFRGADEDADDDAGDGDDDADAPTERERALEAEAAAAGVAFGGGDLWSVRETCPRCEAGPDALCVARRGSARIADMHQARARVAELRRERAGWVPEPGDRVRIGEAADETIGTAVFKGWTDKGEVEVDDLGAGWTFTRFEALSLWPALARERRETA